MPNCLIKSSYKIFVKSSYSSNARSFVLSSGIWCHIKCCQLLPSPSTFVSDWLLQKYLPSFFSSCWSQGQWWDFFLAKANKSLYCGKYLIRAIYYSENLWVEITRSEAHIGCWTGSADDTLFLSFLRVAMLEKLIASLSDMEMNPWLKLSFATNMSPFWDLSGCCSVCQLFWDKVRGRAGWCYRCLLWKPSLLTLLSYWGQAKSWTWLTSYIVSKFVYLLPHSVVSKAVYGFICPMWKMSARYILDIELLAIDFRVYKCTCLTVEMIP